MLWVDNAEDLQSCKLFIVHPRPEGPRNEPLASFSGEGRSTHALAWGAVRGAPPAVPVSFDAHGVAFPESPELL